MNFKAIQTVGFCRILLIIKRKRIGSAYQTDETEHTSAKCTLYVAEMYY